MKIKTVGDSYAFIKGETDAGQNGMLSLGIGGDGTVGTVSVNGRAFAVRGSVCSVPVTAFKTGSNRVVLRRQNGRTIPCAGIRLTGGLFSPEKPSTEDVVAVCDGRFAALYAAFSALEKRVKALEDDFGIFP